ncbi:hypothetical protein M434DRAFT_27526 [Hypoxylon sp. CO27-5]|nr:hypothetical protein M434DRAFT_27526 [Hypoxylon sp. CO27-5]
MSSICLELGQFRRRFHPTAHSPTRGSEIRRRMELFGSAAPWRLIWIPFAPAATCVTSTLDDLDDSTQLALTEDLRLIFLQTIPITLRFLNSVSFISHRFTFIADPCLVVCIRPWSPQRQVDLVDNDNHQDTLSIFLFSEAE